MMLLQRKAAGQALQGCPSKSGAVGRLVTHQLGGMPSQPAGVPWKAPPNAPPPLHTLHLKMLVRVKLSGPRRPKVSFQYEDRQATCSLS